jgi:transcriptional regulator with XRE-family HTH domain
LKPHQHVGQALRSLRERSGLSVKALAEACGVSRAYVWQIESGARPLPLKLAGLVADACNAGDAGIRLLSDAAKLDQGEARDEDPM